MRLTEPGDAAPGREAATREPMLTQVADSVWVRQSEWVWTNSIAVRGEDGLILIDDDQVSAYEMALDRLDEAAGHVGEEPIDAHLEDADWLSRPHQSNLEQARGR